MAARILQLVRDGLANVMSGAGTASDKRSYARYFLNRLDPVQIDAMYRSSWLMRKVVDLPPYDMTRAGRDWKVDKADIAKLEAEEKRLQLWPKLRRALILGRLGGGALILGTDDPRPDQPLDPGRIRSGGLRYIVPVSRYQLRLDGLVRDPADPLFMQPRFYRLSSGGGEAAIHPSRVVPFKGLPIAEVGQGMSEDELFWGDSVLQSVHEAISNADAAQGGFASLIEEAKQDIIKIPGLMDHVGSAEYEQRLMKRFEVAALGKSTHRALVLDGAEEWEQRQLTWNGIPDIIRTYLAIVAGAADIPATRLLGKAPDGMNATGAGDEANYWTMIAARQESDLRPALDVLDPLLAASAGVSGHLYSEFAPLKLLSEKEAADVNKVKADTVKVIADTGLVPDMALEKAVQNLLVEDAWLPGLDEALDELPEDERFPSLAEPTDPAQLGLVDPAAKGGDPASQAMGGGSQPAALARAANDAAPRTLYVQRKLLNAEEFIRWAKGQGFETTTPADELHVTIAFSRQPVDWMRVGEAWSGDKNGELVVKPGGARLVEPLGDKGAVVLLFNSSELSWRHEEIKRAGASFDFEGYQPHVTITYAKPADLDLSKVEPFRGELRFGPEIFSEVDDGWEQRLTEE